MMDSLSRVFQCVVCFDDGLRCLPCGHSICGKCIQTIPSRQCPICGRPLPVNVDEAPVNYQLMSARDEITTVLGRLSAMEDAFRQLKLNMENAIQEKVEEAMDIERVQIKQDIDKLMAERQNSVSASAGSSPRGPPTPPPPSSKPYVPAIHDLSLSSNRRRSASDSKAIMSDVEKLNDVKHNQEDERKKLRDLAEIFEKSPYLKDYNRSDKISETMLPTEVPPAIVYSTEPSASPNSFLNGYLWKKSTNKMHKSWLRRKCQVRNGVFTMWHSDENSPPVHINLLTCQIKSDKSDKKCFDVVSYERIYHFQADDEQQAANWLFSLSKNRDTLHSEAFRDERQSSDHKITSAIERIKNLPGNEKCCDCGSDKDVEWVCVNIGSIHCIDCSGIHRELGVHVSRIQSLNLDHADVATLLIPLATGNKIVNEVYESNMDTFPKKAFTIKSNLRKSFIVSKYVDKKFVAENDTQNMQKLFADSVNDGHVKNLLQCYACGVDLNSILDEDVFENALFMAVRNDENGSHLPYIHFLIQNGIDVNRVNLSGDTAMHVAVRLNKPDCLKLILFGRNLRLSLANGSEETAKHLARRLNASLCEQLILNVEQNDKSELENVDLPRFLLPLDVDVKSEDDSVSVSAGSSPRGPPTPPPPSSKPYVPTIHDLPLSSNHRRSASDSKAIMPDVENKATTALSPIKKRLPGAKWVLPPVVFPSNSSEKPNKIKNNINLKQMNSSASSECDASSSENLSPTSLSMPPKPAPRQIKLASKPNLKRCRALYDCKADNEDELGFKKGDILLVTKDCLREDDNWLEGFVDGNDKRVGLFPVTFVTFEI